MRKTRLLSTVAATLLISIGAASAQGTKEQAPSRAPAAQQNAPAEKVAPSMHEGQRKGSETTGQGQQEMKPGDHQSPGQTQKSPGQTQNEMKPGDRKSQTTGQSPRDSSESGKPGMKSQSQERGDTKSHNERGANDMKAKPDSKTEGANPSRSSESTTDRDRTTTGQGAAGSAKLSTEQRTKITTIIREHKVEPTRLNVAVRVGTRIPESVRFHPLPVEVINVYPQWRGYNYILVGEQIVVIDPGTHEIVAVLEA